MSEAFQCLYAARDHGRISTDQYQEAVELSEAWTYYTDLLLSNVSHLPLDVQGVRLANYLTHIDTLLTLR